MSERILRRGITARVSRRMALRLTALGGVATVVACAGPPTQIPSAPSPAPAAPTAPAPTVAATAAKAPPATAAPPKPVTITKLKVSWPIGSFETAFFLLGQQKQIFREQGLDPEFIGIQDSAVVVKGLIAGENDIVYLSPTGIFPAVEGGAEIKLVAICKPRPNYSLYAKKEITRLEELNGRTVGIGPPQGLLHSLMLGLLFDKKIDASGINFVNIGSGATVYKAVSQGKVDAGPSNTEFLAGDPTKPDIHALVNFAEAMPLYAMSSLTTGTKTIRDRREMVASFVLASARSFRYGLEHRDELVNLAVDKLGLDRPQAELSHKQDIEQRIVDPDMDVRPEGVEWMQQLNVRIGSQKAVLPYDRVATREFYNQVIATLGPYKWP